VNDVYALLRAIRDRRLSRNRNFEEHATKHGAEARRLHRFLLAIERDLMAADTVEVRERDGGVVISMGFASVRLKRVVSLTVEEHALLAEDPRLAERLRAG
jgi:hypothetical protein